MLKPSLLIALLSVGTILNAWPYKNRVQEETCCPRGPKYMRAAIRHIEAGGIGYNNGYTTFEAFVANDPSQWCVTPFIDARWHIFDTGRFAANAGVGLRGIAGCRVYGMSAYYDYRDSKHKGFNQIGLGFETLGELWDLRINGYLPVGGKMSELYGAEFGGFSGHSVLVDFKYTQAMKGIDGDVGFHFGKTRNFDFYAAAGPYYFKGHSGKGAVGGKARIAGFYKDFITLELRDSYDTVFHNNFQGELTFTLPLGPRTRPSVTKDCCPDTCDFAVTLAQRMVQPVARQEIIVDKKRTKTETLPEFVIFVDNLSHSAGTFESPYPTLLEAQENSRPGDIIYVLPGDGTTTGMDQGITLQANQKFWGSGVGHFLKTNFGSFYIPPTTSSNPHITAGMSGGTMGYGVILARNNEVSGFVIEDTYKSGITGTDIENVTISSCTVLRADRDMSEFEAIELYFNSIDGNVTIGDLKLLDSRNEGVYVETNNSTFANVSISNSTFSGNSYPVDIESFDYSGVNVSIQGSKFTDNSNSIYLYANTNPAEVLSYSLDSNVIQSSGEGIYFESDLQAVCDVSITNSKLYGCSYPIDIESYNTSRINFLFEGNLVTDNSYYVYLYSNSDSGDPLTYSLNDNVFQNTLTDSSIYAEFYSAGPIQLSAHDNTLTHNEGAPNLLYHNTVDSTLSLKNNTFEHTDDTGIYIEKTGANVLSATFENNEFSNNNGPGTFINAGSSSICAFMKFNQSFDNDGSPYFFTNPSGTLKIGPCNAADINESDLFGDISGTFQQVHSCPSGASCP